jgi:hypothetical protein
MNYMMKEALKIPSVKRTLNTLAIFSILVVAAPLANLTASAAQPENGCLRNATANATISEQNGKAVATFTVPKKCDDNKHTVSLVVYKLNDGNWEHKIKNQYIYAHKTIQVGTGKHTVSVNLPNCGYQADLVKGQPVDVSTGAHQNHILAAHVGGNRVACAAKPTPKPTPNTPIPTPETPATTVTTVSGEQPTTLVNTGPGDVAAAFVGISALGSAGYHFLIRRRLGLNV